MINYNKIKDQKYYEDDYCDFKIHVVDNGDDKITAKIHCNILKYILINYFKCNLIYKKIACYFLFLLSKIF